MSLVGGRLGIANNYVGWLRVIFFCFCAKCRIVCSNGELCTFTLQSVCQNPSNYLSHTPDMISPIVWIFFIALVVLLMSIDLGVFNKKAHIPSAKEAIYMTMGWVGLALLFNLFVYFAYENKWWNLGNGYEKMSGSEAALKYFTGYLLEESLSIDNLFVIALVFAQFQVPKKYQHRILFWGILGVLVFRGILIGVGVALVQNFTWLFYAFGALLVYSAYKMLRQPLTSEQDVNKRTIVRIIRKFYPVSSRYDEGRFFTIENGRRAATPMFVALMVIETTDILFAFDSVPAVFSITTDPFLVFSSNIFAILGLRSLYFVLANVLDRFEYLRYSLIVILFFIGIKMFLIPLEIHIPIGWSLGLIGLFLLIGVGASLSRKKFNSHSS